MTRTLQTARPPSNWHLINVDTGQRLDWGLGLRWYLTTVFQEQLAPLPEFDLLYRRRSTCFDDFLLNATAGRPPVAHNWVMMALPVEVLERIFEEVENILDAIFLCLSCKYLLRVGHRVCSNRIAKIAGPWAGARIICYRDPDWKGSKGNASHKELWPGGMREELVDLDQVKSNIDPDTYTPVLDITLTDDLKNKVSSFETGLFEHFIHHEPQPPWLLCNLSKRQYVLYDGEKEKAWDELGTVLVSQICWFSGASENNLENQHWKDAPKRGKWVGDRFEITTMDNLIGDGWTDVSEELFAETNIIRRSWFIKLGMAKGTLRRPALTG